MTLTASPRCIEFIKGFEEFEPLPYLCPARVWTIGYGTTRGITAHTPSITEQQAYALLMGDVRKCEKTIYKLITRPLNQNQFDALVSFVYNLGGGALQRSTLRRKLNRGEIGDAANEFLKWVRAEGVILKGLVRRRQAERLMFLDPVVMRNSPVQEWIESAMT